MRRFSLSALLMLLATASFGATRTWTGTNSGSWIDAGNWGGTAPVAGDDLVFPSGASNINNTNDFAANTAFHSITFSGADYVLNGNVINLGAGGLTSTTGAVSVSIPFVLTASQPWTVTGLGLTQAGAVDLGGGTLTLDITNSFGFGTITGSGAIVKSGGQGEVVMVGNNTFSGPLTFNSGTLFANGANVFGVSDNTPTNGTVINTGATLRLGAFTFSPEHITLNGAGTGGSGVLTGGTATLTGTVVLGTSVAMNVSLFTVQFNGQVTGSGQFGMNNNGFYFLGNPANDFTGGIVWGVLGSPSSVLVLTADNVIPDSFSLNIPAAGRWDLNNRSETITSVNGAGPIQLGVGGALTLTNPTGTYSGGVNVVGSVTISGGNTTWTGASTYTGIFTHTGGTFLLNGATGALPAAFTQSAGTFGISSGATAGFVTINGGTFAPGNGGLGNANTGNLALAPAATYSEVINGIAAATFGNVHVTGSVTLVGAALVLTGSGAGVAPGNTITVIDNDGADPVAGTFAGLPQGAVIIGGPGGLNYQISYTGGTGNDVVLTALDPTAIPALDPRALVALAVVLGMIAVVSLRR